MNFWTLLTTDVGLSLCLDRGCLVVNTVHRGFEVVVVEVDVAKVRSGSEDRIDVLVEDSLDSFSMCIFLLACILAMIWSFVSLWDFSRS